MLRLSYFLGNYYPVGGSQAFRYTLNRRGAMLGWEMSPDQLGDGRPEVTGPIDGFYFVGHWTKPGGGITPVIVSAMRVARLITGSSQIARSARNVRHATVRAEGHSPVHFSP